LGGVRGRTEATGRGVFFGVRHALSYAEDVKNRGLSPGLEGKRVVVQGLGNVGYHTAKFLQEAGAIVVALAEYDGAICHPKGLDVDKVQAHRRETGTILNFPGAKNFEKNTDALEYECDILIPAALERVITEENAPRIKAKIVAEAANGPTTAEAEAILQAKGVMIIPDLYLNAGGVEEPQSRPLRSLEQAVPGSFQPRPVEHAGAADRQNALARGTKADRARRR
jgi:glutamate dehydrogenase (NAD(P)+)